MCRKRSYQRFFITGFFIFVCLARTAVSQAKESKTGDGYLLELFTQNVFQTHAQAKCENRSGWLVRIKDSNMDESVKQLKSGVSYSNSNDDYYIGLQYIRSKWFWNDGTELTSEQANWGSGEGDDIDQNCASFSRINNKWSDVGCTQIRRYICQSDLLTITTDKNKTVVIKGQSVTVKLAIERQEIGKTEIDVYKLPDTTNAVETLSNVETEAFFTIHNISESDGGTYTFAAKPHNRSYVRSTTVNVIVHVPVYIESLYPKTITSPVTIGHNSVNCTAYGIPLPEINWQINGTDVQNEKHNGVYQEKTNNVALLFIESAFLSDQGIYTCTAINYVEKEGNVRTAQNNITLSVYGAPTITDYVVDKCRVEGKVSITWQPNTQTIAINHKVDAVQLNPSGNVDSKNLLSNTEQTTTFSNLTSLTNYCIKITVCPDECITKLNTSIVVTTGAGLPNPVSNASVYKRNQTCEVEWIWTDNIPLINTSFEIIETSSLVYTPPAIDQKNFNKTYVVEREAFSMGIETKPNRRYVFNVTAKTCAGRSKDIKAVGECVTESAAPDNIITPVIANKNSNTELRISIPEETNGQISCIFVLMKSGGSTTNTSEFKKYQLEQAEKAANTDIPGEGVEYLALAIRRSTIDGTETNVILGDGSTSACNTYDASKRIRRSINNSSSDYTGKNWPLTNEMTYTYYIVTSTPTDTGDVKFGQSLPTTFKHVYVKGSKNSDMSWIAGLVIGILLAMVLAFVAFYYTKRNKQKYVKQPNPTLDLQPTVEVTVYENLQATEEDDEINTSPTSIPIDQLKEHFEEMNANDGEKFSEEFEKLKRQAITTFSTECALQSFSTKKNRYKNILPYDGTRVALQGEGEKSYINASYIHGYSKSKKFIATQGPLPSTVNDFWRMVVEKESKIIVMLTKCTEAGKKKCEKYWPDLGETLHYEVVGVSCDNEMNFGGYVKRTFTVTYGESKPYTVEQYHFINWPDHGVPLTTSSFIRFYLACMEAYNNADWRIIVHCSAGAGRTGAFIGFDYLLEEYLKTRHIDIYECVFKMRQQRIEMVQTCEQYKLLHKLLLETHLFGNTDNGPTEIKKKLHEKGNRLIQEEFTKIGAAASISKIKEQKRKGHDVAIRWLPEDGESRPRINAHKIETFNDSVRMLAAESPTVSSVEFFWRAILDNDVALLVMLNEVKKNSDSIQYWPSHEGESGIFGKVSVELTSTYSSGHFIERHFAVTNEAHQKTITQYQILGWSSDLCPDDPSLILDVIRRVNRYTDNRHDSDVLVHCNDGVGRCGVFCTIYNIANRLKTENQADVFRAVKDVQDCRSEMVQNLDQYKFCYKAADAWLDSNAACIAVGNEYENLDLCRVEKEIANESPYENA